MTAIPSSRNNAVDQPDGVDPLFDLMGQKEGPELTGLERKGFRVITASRNLFAMDSTEPS